MFNELDFPCLNVVLLSDSDVTSNEVELAPNMHEFDVDVYVDNNEVLVDNDQLVENVEIEPGSVESEAKIVI